MRMYYIERDNVTATEVEILTEDSFSYTDSRGTKITQQGTPFQHWFYKNSIDAIFALAQQRREWAVMINR